MTRALPPEPFWNRPCAAPGLISYRYVNGPYGFVMIGAKDDADALSEAGRSVTGHVYPDRLERWNGESYAPVWPTTAAA